MVVAGCPAQWGLSCMRGCGQEQFVSSHSGTSVELNFCLAGFLEVGGARREFRHVLI